MKSEMHN